MRNTNERKLYEEFEQAVASGTTKASNMAGYMEEKAREGVRTKMTLFLQAQAEREAEAKKNKPHTYGEIIKTAKKTKADMERLKDEPQRLAEEQRRKLNKEFDELVENELFSNTGTTRALWIARKMEEYFGSEEYLTAKDDLKEATNLYAECLALKEQWETDNASIIEAERLRSKREELLSADPETLRALGITPVERASKKSAVGSEAEGMSEREKALRAIHPSATDADIRAML